VEERAEEWIEWRVPNDPLLDIALIHLTLARAGLYREILRAGGGGPARPSASDPVGRELAAAVDGLRRAGTMDHLPRGVLTSALFRHVRGNEAGCRADLEEARRIAERGPMRLFLADIHLARARLFGDAEELEKAAELIEETGYGRREEELEDARRMMNEEGRSPNEK
jgi:hypothetical protein